MLADQIVRADLATRSLPRSVDVREFAAREFPNEDCRWVAASVSGGAPSKPFRARVGLFLRSFGTRRKGGPEVDPALEPTATA